MYMAFFRSDMFKSINIFTGAQEPLLVKFADGGNKKKNQYQTRQWIDRGEVTICSNLAVQCPDPSLSTNS